MAETVAWIREKLRAFGGTWLRHHTCASRDILLLPVCGVADGIHGDRLFYWSEERAERDCAAVRRADLWLISPGRSLHAFETFPVREY
eukprot:6477618-Amphidinium_carterae.3